MSYMASNILGNTGTDDAAASTTTDRMASDKNTFLKLLVAQLTHQDPLNPTEDKEFVAQLAQFTSLEQLQEINSGVGSLNDTMHQSQMMTATGFIGKDIITSGSQVTKFNDSEGNVYTTKVWYTIDDPAEKIFATVVDSSTKEVIFSQEMGSHNAGTYDDFRWAGVDYNGKEVAEGVYEVIISARDANDKAVLVNTQFSARVVGVMSEDGVYKLALDGGRVVPLTDVTTITNATETSNGGDSSTGDAEDGGGESGAEGA